MTYVVNPHVDALFCVVALIEDNIIYYFTGSAAQRVLPHLRGFLITHNVAPQSVGLLLDE
jgi:hypothetical protein